VEVTRGAVVIVSARGAYTGKPRPALVVQADSFNPTHASVTICPITTACIDAPLFRVNVPPGERTGLRTASQVMVDKIASVPRASIVRRVGRCDEATAHAVDDALRNWLGV
jgi:mRNA interferase MazF